MSYDLHIGDAEFNYTYNLSRLFHKHIKDDEGAGIRCLDGLTGRQAALVLWAVSTNNPNVAHMNHAKDGKSGDE